MFTFFIQYLDLIFLNQLGLFFVFFVISWTIFLIKAFFFATRHPLAKISSFDYNKGVTAIVPVYKEPLDVWERTLSSLKEAMETSRVGNSQVLVVANGEGNEKLVEMAQKYGFETIQLKNPSKRHAILAGVENAKNDVCVILDSDTQVCPNSIKKLVKVFSDKTVGGATPRHVIYERNRNIFRKVSDWLEDVRFEETAKPQSSFGCVSCLPGRLLAVRTDLLKKIAPKLVSQKFLGKPCVSGDDRFITSEILKMGFKTVFVPNSLVYTEAPDTLKKFVLQRLRWSRSSLRETILSFGWSWKYPFMFFTNWSMVLTRWLFFVVVLSFIFYLLGLTNRRHFLDLPLWLIVFGTILGFLVSGFLRNLRHLWKKPSDILFLPVYLLVTTFILTPVEWFGNLTIFRSEWLTRK